MRSTLLVLAARLALAAAAPPKLILFTFADDFGWHNVGFRNAEMRTPTIDRLASSGIVLERHYGFKFCSPSRCALLSGRLPIHVNQGQPQGVLATGGVDLHMTTLGEKLQQARWYTAWFGKWQ